MSCFGPLVTVTHRRQKKKEKYFLHNCSRDKEEEIHEIHISWLYIIIIIDTIERKQTLESRSLHF